MIFVKLSKKICIANENELHKIKTQVWAEKLCIPHDCNVHAFKEIVTKVSMFAIRELYKQYDEMVKFGTLEPIYSGNITRTIGPSLCS